jgi:hypothetical protein
MAVPRTCQPRTSSTSPSTFCPLADHGSAAVLSAPARRAQCPVAARRHPWQRNPQRRGQARTDRNHPHHEGPRAPARYPADGRGAGAQHGRTGAHPERAPAGRAGDLRRGAEKVRVFGIELLDIRFKRINYNESVRPKIYDRMISERRQIAERFLSEGNGEAARIRGNRVRDLNKIQSEAYRQVEEIRGVADATAPRSMRRLTVEARRQLPSSSSRERCGPIRRSSLRTPRWC